MVVERVVYFVIPSEARNLSLVQAQQKKERFLASLGMTKVWSNFSGACEPCPTRTSPEADSLAVVPPQPLLFGLA